jgi:hypothetical protein
MICEINKIESDKADIHRVTLEILKKLLEDIKNALIGSCSQNDNAEI